MNSQGTSAALVRKVRTFADDVMRAKAPDGAPVKMEHKSQKGAPAQKTALSRLSAPSHLADDTKPLDIRREAGHAPPESTVIQDTRRKRWTLGKALGRSFSTWVDDQKDTIARMTDPKNPEPTVPPSETRTNVIQAAREKSAIAPQDDRHAIVEKLRTFARDAQRITGKPYAIVHKPTLEKAVPSWSYAVNDQLESDTKPLAIHTAVTQKAPPIKQARRTIRPQEAPLAARASSTPLQPAKSLIKDVAPVAQQTLPEAAFGQLQKTEAAQSKQRMPISYGVADVAPVVIRKPEVQKQAAPPEVAVVAPLKQPEAKAEQPKQTTPVSYGISDVAPLATAREHKTEVPIAPETDGVTESDQSATLRHAAIEQLLSVRKRYTGKSAPAAPVQPKTPSRDIAFEKPVFATAKTTGFRTYREDAIHDVEENKRSIPNIAAAEAVRRTERPPKASPAFSARPFVIAGMSMILIIAVGGFGLFWYARQSVREDTTMARIPTFMTIEVQESAPFSTNRAALLETLAAKVRAAGAGITQIYPTDTDGQSGKAGGIAVATSDFLYVLDPRAPGSFIRTLSEEMMFGAHNGADPFFVFKTTQFDSAFAGMLDWEPYMSTDLAPLFGDSVERTFDATARTIDHARGAYFVDDTLQNVDVRILYDDTGKERLLYAFLNKNTLVITASSAALTELIERLQ